MSSARYAVEVMAGVIPGQPIDELTRRWFVSSEEWAREAKSGSHQVTDERSPWWKARDYAETLVDPSRVNWVQIQWVWF